MRNGVAKGSTFWRVAGHASSKLGRFSVQVDIVMRRSEFVEGGVAARIPIDGDVIHPGNLLDFFRKCFVRPTECKVGNSIRGNGYWFYRRITHCHRIRRDWHGSIVLETEYESVITVIIDILL